MVETRPRPRIGLGTGGWTGRPLGDLLLDPRAQTPTDRSVWPALTPRWEQQVPERDGLAQGHPAPLPLCVSGAPPDPVRAVPSVSALPHCDFHLEPHSARPCSTGWGWGLSAIPTNHGPPPICPACFPIWALSATQGFCAFPGPASPSIQQGLTWDVLLFRWGSCSICGCDVFWNLGVLQGSRSQDFT